MKPDRWPGRHYPFSSIIVLWKTCGRSALVNGPGESPVKPGYQNSGWRRCRLPDRGNSGPTSLVCSNTATPSPPSIWTRPTWANGPAGQARSCGGSLITQRPPTRSSGAAHSMVTAGGPKLRAMTASWCPRRVSSRPKSSARPVHTSARSSTPSSTIAHRQNAIRRCEESTSTNDRSGSATSRGNDGTPPPAPRSTTFVRRPLSDRSARPAKARR